ncbi:MAG TPA: hypothetical protein VFQ43_10900 [Nitrososphaera sp.]|nr:hypothetical protein [Nitrososphaera sp.]
MNNHNRPLQSLEEVLIEFLNPRGLRERFGLPHPLSKFAVNGTVKEGPYADAILQFIQDWKLSGPRNERDIAARWFLFESELAFFRACGEAGIDAEKLRSHLLRCRPA